MRTPVPGGKLERALNYIREHPGCSVTSIRPIVEADEWSYLIDLEAMGLITSDNSNGGKWAFYTTELANR